MTAPEPAPLSRRRRLHEEAGGGRGVRHGRLRGRTPAGAVAALVGSVAAVALVSSVGVGAFAVLDTVRSIRPAVHLQLAAKSGGSQPAPDVAAATGEINVLLAGTDTRTGQGGSFDTPDELAGSAGAGNNDVTMVLHVAADHRSAAVISIPRDLVVPIPECIAPGGGTLPATTDMFNSTLSRGGLSCVVATAQKLTGLSIPFAAEISFDGVIAMSNAVGGVPVCLATPVTDPYVGLDLPAGEQTLVGADALAFLRSRHGVGDGSDLGRISDQQLFLSALMRKATSAGVLSNPLTLYTLARAATQNIQFSDTLASPTTLVSLALALKSIPLGQFVFLQYPAVTDPSDTARVIPDDSAVSSLQEALASGQPLALTGQTGVATQPAPASSAGPADGSTPAPAPPATGSPSPEPSAVPTATAATPTPTPTAGVLPSSVTGQTAAEQTCTKGN